MVVTERMWDALCAAIDRHELCVDPRFSSGAARRENGDALHDEIARWTRERTKYDAMHELAGAGVPCSAVLSTSDLFTDPHLTARGLVHDLEHPEAGPIRVMGSPIRMSQSAVAVVPAPSLGQHTDEVLAADLGLDPAEVADLHARGVIGVG